MIATDLFIAAAMLVFPDDDEGELEEREREREREDDEVTFEWDWGDFTNPFTLETGPEAKALFNIDGVHGDGEDFSFVDDTIFELSVGGVAFLAHLHTRQDTGRSDNSFGRLTVHRVDEATRELVLDRLRGEIYIEHLKEMIPTTGEVEALVAIMPPRFKRQQAALGRLHTLAKAVHLEQERT
jgi:hypothetical protein